MILALESASRACSAALCGPDGITVAEAYYGDGPAHTRKLLLAAHEVLEEAGVQVEEVGPVAVGLGPGAFTGLRIGIATARALAQAGGVGIVGVPTASALALAALEADSFAPAAGERIVALLDGKRNEVFATVFGCAEGEGLRQELAVQVVPVAELTAWLHGLGEVAVVGEEALFASLELPPSARRARGVHGPTAAMVGRAAACGAPGVVQGFSEVLPLYGRSPDAVPTHLRGAPA